MKSLKILFAGCSLFLSSMAMSQALPLERSTGYFWIDGKDIRIAYSNLAAPGSVSNTLMLQTLAEVEAKIDGLNLPGLTVSIDTSVRATGCSVRQPNEVLVCWTPVDGNTSGVLNIGGGLGTNFWHEGNVMLDTQSTWTGRDMLYSNIMHQLMHIVGFGHPNGSGTSVLNGAADLTAVDIAGLSAEYSASRCAVSLVANEIDVPYVTFRGNSYHVKLRYNGGTSFSLIPGSISMYGSVGFPATPCLGLAVDGTNEVHFPAVNVNGVMYNGTLRLDAGTNLTLIASGRN